MISIKEAQPNELNAIQDIAHKTWPVTYGDILSSDSMQYMLDKFYPLEGLNKNLLGGHHFFIAWEDDRPVGFVSCEFDYPNIGITKIPKIYVLPEVQGKGVGKTLIDKVILEAEKRGNFALTLNVNRKNNARLFYEKLGFSVEGEEDVDIGNGYFQEDYVMTLPLSSS